MITREVIEAKRAIGDVLNSFKVKFLDINATVGPTVTSYSVTPEQGVRISKIRNLKDEMAIALKVSGVNIVAPQPDGTVGIEVPNKQREIIPMADMLYSQEYMTTDMQLPIAMGREKDGSIFIADLAEMPHLLIAGATGMGKSVGLNVIISSLINSLSPDELKFVMIDPKCVELTVYDAIEKPYLAKLNGYENPIITGTTKAKETLDAVCRLMDSRYNVLKEARVRNIKEYNDRNPQQKMPFYVIIIDEYGDLILQSTGREMETAICRIAQKARAVGIHMIISTQRPAATIVTGNIKANFPARMAFRTISGTDSRVILDRVGAEKLTGKGDMLYFNGGETVRVQCAYISTDEVMEFCNEIEQEFYDSEMTYLPGVPEPEKMLLFTEVLPETIKLGNTLTYWNYYRDKPWEPLSKAALQLMEMGIISDVRTEYGYQVLIKDRKTLKYLYDNFYNG